MFRSETVQREVSIEDTTFQPPGEIMGQGMVLEVVKEVLLV